ncbi:hypothetical protein GDO81_004032 [Engystomops pustulosus]|uniref:Uncharacterized protein n=1 Tax=Engystomops pustulosus TaxID=76066 RepID=A0AAV6ZY43_ENGPU|nr:hypothetical protein GDO81_004032 [Engystomops pustulosus]
MILASCISGPSFRNLTIFLEQGLVTLTLRRNILYGDSCFILELCNTSFLLRRRYRVCEVFANQDDQPVIRGQTGWNNGV